MDKIWGEATLYYTVIITGIITIGINITLTCNFWFQFYIMLYSWEPEASGHWTRLYFDLYITLYYNYIYVKKRPECIVKTIACTGIS